MQDEKPTLLERFFPGTVEKIIKRRTAQGRYQTSAEAASRETNAFRKARLSREASELYDSNGAAQMIVDRNRTFVYEQGFELSLDFAQGFPEQVADLIERRVFDNFWDNVDLDIPGRIETLLTESAIVGEHFWRFHTLDSGDVLVADLGYLDVDEVGLDIFDKRQLGWVKLATAAAASSSDKDRILPAIRVYHGTEHPEYDQHLFGQVMQFKLGVRDSARGIGLLHQIIDELTDFKVFTRDTMDRITGFLVTIFDVALKDGTQQDVKEYVEEFGSNPPPPGSKHVHSTDVEAKWMHPDLQSGQFSELIKTLVGIIMGSRGMPLSWFGFGDGTNFATANAQQFPIFADYMVRQARVIAFLRRAVRFVIDQYIVSGVVLDDKSVDREFMKQFTGRSGKQRSERVLLRDGIDVVIKPRPLPNAQVEQHFAATKTAFEIIGSDILASTDGGRPRILTPENEVALVNAGLRIDKVSMEVKETEETIDKATPQPTEPTPDGTGRPENEFARTESGG